MTEKPNKPTLLRVTNSLCAFALLGGILYVLFAGLNFAVMSVLILALVGLTGPVVADGEGLVEVVTGVFEAIVEGITAVFSAIADGISNLFG